MGKMKKWSVLVALVATFLVTLASPGFVLAQDGEDVARIPGLNDSLAVVAPRLARTGENISVRVFQCSDQEPVEGAGVWLIGRDQSETLREEMSALKENDSLTAGETDYESLVSIHGTLIGYTGDSGRVWYTFEEAGRYVLVAVKAGYIPDFRPIAIGMLSNALHIEAPRRAEVEEKITINVSQRGTEDPVKDAGVWALTREQAESLQSEMSALRESGDRTALEAAIGEAVDIHGIFLGTTNGSGKLHYAFEEAGGYLLVTRKAEYFPGFRRIVIGLSPVAANTGRGNSSIEATDNGLNLQ